MNFRSILGAAAISALSGTSALAVWGVKYEVNSGSGWTDATTIDVSGGPQTIDFRISVYHDGSTLVQTTSTGIKTAWAPLRLCNSQTVTNFGWPGSGDSVVSFTRTTSAGNAKALAIAQSGSDAILGTPNVLHSFSSNLDYSISGSYVQQLNLQFYAGKLRIGNSSSAAQSRTITLTAFSFGYPGADTGTGGPYGASFFTTPVNGALGKHGIVQAPAVVLPAVITVKVPCPADLNGDGFVGDPDFEAFCIAHDLADCADPAMPEGCPADFNHDGIVDDSDFTVLAAAYDALVCN